MSLSGLRKQFNKANQYLSETVGAAEATKLDDAYNEMEKNVDTTYELISALVIGTNEYLQPNPATRAKMATMGALSKVSGTAKTSPYPQTEGMLAETMTKFGQRLGDQSDLGKALIDSGEAYRRMADIKYQMEDSVKQNFLDPLSHLQNNELKEVNHHRTKLKGRRLDYDCKKRQQRRDEELIQAEEKLEESKRLAEMSMYNVLTNDVEQVAQLRALVDAQLDFHRQTMQVLEQLQGQLANRMKEASSRQRPEHIPLPVLTAKTPRSRSPNPETMPGGAPNYNTATSSGYGAQGAYAPPSYQQNGSNAYPSAAQPQQQVQPQQQQQYKATAKALFDFEAQNKGELDFKEGQFIELTSQIDENWFEGRLDGRQGLFPVSYVQIINPIR